MNRTLSDNAEYHGSNPLKIFMIKTYNTDFKITVCLIYIYAYIYVYIYIYIFFHLK